MTMPAPLIEVDRILGLPTVAEREAAMLLLDEQGMRSMVRHFLARRYAIQLAESDTASGAHEAVLAQIPESLKAEVLPLARCFWVTLPLVKAAAERKKARRRHE